MNKENYKWYFLGVSTALVVVALTELIKWVIWANAVLTYNPTL